MVALSGGTLISDCHRSIIYMGDADEYRCIQCTQPCNSAGTLSDLWQDDNPAPQFCDPDPYPHPKLETE